jgi:hypothetical protein
VWTVRLHSIPEDRLEDLEAYCYEASMKDPTFKFTVEGKDGKVENVIIECTSKDHAYRRGTLFHHRFGCYFEVEWKRE